MSEIEEPITWKSATKGQRVKGVFLLLSVLVPIMIVKANWTKVTAVFADKVEMTQLPGVMWKCDVTTETDKTKYWMRFDENGHHVNLSTDAGNPDVFFSGNYGVTDSQAHTVKMVFPAIWLDGRFDAVSRLSNPPGYGRYEWEMTITKAIDGKMKFKAVEEGVHNVADGLVRNPITGSCEAS